MGSLSPRGPLTRLHRSTWKMEPSLPPQNMWCSARSMVTDMMPMSNKTDSSRSPEEMAQSCRDGKPGAVDIPAHSPVGEPGGLGAWHHLARYQPPNTPESQALQLLWGAEDPKH